MTNILGLLAICIGTMLMTGCDAIISTSYQRHYMPEIVNSTPEKIDVLLVFENGEKDMKRLYYRTLPVNSSIPIWIASKDQYAYLIGSYYNLVDEVFVLKSGACADLIPFSEETPVDSNGQSITMTPEQMATFTRECPFMTRISGQELDKIRMASKFYPHDATCLMLHADGSLSAVRESELPWFTEYLQDGSAGSIISICGQRSMTATGTTNSTDTP